MAKEYISQKNLTSESGNAALLQPNIQAIKCGAKTRVGFIPTCVIDANRARSEPTINPIKIGAVLLFSLPTFAPFLNKKIISTNKIITKINKIILFLLKYLLFNNFLKKNKKGKLKNIQFT